MRIPTPAIYFEDHPAGTVVTTPGDHIRILLALLGDGRYHGYQLLEPETVRAMLTPEVTLAPDVAVGLVWNLLNWDHPDRSFGHSGAHMWGWTNTYAAYPNLDLAVAVFMNQWSLPDDGQGARYREAKLVIDFVRSWMMRERAGTLQAVRARPWAWKVSYVQGLMMVDYVNGILGISERLSPAAIETMVRGAAPRADRDGAARWDPDGFRTGLDDLAREELTPAGIATFLGSDRLQVLPEELPLIYLELGGRGTFPAPN